MLARQLQRHQAPEIIIKVPFLADSINQGTLAQWDKKVGQFVKRDEAVAQIETDKVGVAVNAPEAGIVMELFAKEGDTVDVGQNLFKLNAGAPDTSEPKATEEKPETKKSEKKPEAKAEPKSQAIKVEPKAEVSKKAEPMKAESVADPFSRSEKRVKLTRMRLRISERLKESQNTAASLTTFNEVDMSSLIDLRDNYKDDFNKKHGVKLGYMSAFVRACAMALQEVPAVNGRIEGGEAIYPDYVDISVAVATPKGLVTPVLRNCHSMTFAQVESSLAKISQKARDGQITLEELAGGTFTISNGGVFGSLMGTPILNTPQSAILGMHAIKERPITMNGQVVSRPMMYLALTYDHRMVDGREAVTFLVRVKQLLEDPRRFLLEV